MKINLTIKTLCLLMTLLVVSGQAMALPCYVTSTSDSGSGRQATLRKVLETNLAENATEICDSEYTPDGDNGNFVGDSYFEQSVLIGPSVSFTSGASPTTIEIGSQLDVDLPWSAVIGNPGDAVIADSSADIDYTASADNNFSSDAPQDSFYNVQYLVIDARNLAEGTNPFDCKNGTADLYFRNTIILTNKVSESDVFSDCVKDAGNTFVCQSGYDSNVIPGTFGWCSLALEILPFDPNWDFDDLLIFKTWYRDADGDGFGDPNDSITTMRGNPDHVNGPAGYVRNNDDCDDTDELINPNGTEICNEKDDDCNGIIDDNATDAPTWYYDYDHDNYGDPDTADTFCDGAYEWVADNTDCDDSVRAVNPGATEICDTIDNDCDGGIDEDDVCLTTGGTDDDGDGFCGDPTCSDGSTPGDCNDANADINPNASEICDSLDNNCDGDTDEDNVCDPSGETDDDGDGFCEGSSCSDGSTPGDCDDTNADINPNASEICDTLDNNCDGSVDEDNVCSGPSTDDDGDGFCEDASSCDDGATPGDCDDADSGINPSSTEICNSIDDNCDGFVDEDDVCSGPIEEGQGLEPDLECSNGTDDDTDGFVDCEDPSCATALVCNTSGEGSDEYPEVECSNGSDDDGDSLTDCMDPGCRNTYACDVGEGDGPNSEEECSDGTDNDNDGFTDCNDSSCTGTLVCNVDGEGLGDNRELECSDKIDNDSDALKDCFDPGCNGTIVCNVLGEGLGNTNDAESECSDGIDSDLDGLTDCNDPNCAGTVTCDENGEGIGLDREQTCSDDIDNDNDKMTDCLDPGCFGTIACSVSGEGLGTDEDREEACADNLDNDIDGLTDCDEPSCHTTEACLIEVTPSIDVDPDTDVGSVGFGGQIQGGSCSLNPAATQGSSMTTLILICLGFIGVFNAARREGS